MDRLDPEIDSVSTSDDLWTVRLDQCAPARIVCGRGECTLVGAECLCEGKATDVEDNERGSLRPEQPRCFGNGRLSDLFEVQRLPDARR